MIKVTRPDASTIEVDADTARIEGDALFLYRDDICVYGFAEWDSFRKVPAIEPTP